MPVGRFNTPKRDRLGLVQKDTDAMGHDVDATDNRTHLNRLQLQPVQYIQYEPFEFGSRNAGYGSIGGVAFKPRTAHIVAVTQGTLFERVSWQHRGSGIIEDEAAEQRFLPNARPD